MKTTTTLALATAMAAGTLAHAQEAVQWRVEDGGNGHWYALIRWEYDVTWVTARDWAVDHGGHLVTMTSAQEDAFATSVALSQPWPNPIRGPYIGAFSTTSCGSNSCYYWVTGEPFDYTRWHPGNPDASPKCPGLVSTCIWDRAGTQAWQDVDACHSLTSFRLAVVEWSADCNGDGIVDYGQCRDGSLPDYNGNNIPDCCEQGVPCEVDRYPVQWRVEDGGNGHWYAFVQWETPQSWAESQNASMQWGGSLACITAAPELSFIESLNRALTDCQGAPVWLVGGYQDLGAPDYSEPGGGWRWVSGEPWDFAAWFPGRPDDFGAGGQHFLSLPEESYPALFDDVEPGNGTTQSCGGLIEWSADCNGDGIVDYGQILLGELGDSNANGVPDVCECDADINDDGTVNGADISVLLGYWGQSGKNVVGDITGDGVVNGADLAQLLGSWGPCQ